MVNNKIVRLLDSGLIYPISDSAWVSPIHVVPKKGGMTVVLNDNNELIPSRTVTGCRVCIDYRKLNDVTILLNSNHTRRSREDNIYLSLWNFFLQEDVVRIMQRSNNFLKMHDGNIHYDIGGKDVMEFSWTFLSIRYCFGTQNILKGIEVDKAKIDVIAKLPYPTNVKGVRSFLGQAGFYRRFIKDFSMISKPMTQFLMKDIKFNFSKDYKKEFNKLKEKLTIVPIIISPVWSVPFELMCDASNFAVGEVLGQRIDGKFKPIYYASKTLNDSQAHYTITEKELHAVVFSFDKFRPYLILSKTVVYTDHSALKYRWVLLLQGFNIKIKDKKGQKT
ncbi:DNA-directed DNA polymerase [Tanacetum coccineum]